MSAEERAGAGNGPEPAATRQAAEQAYAKINLSLDITGRRDDGYHLVSMVMQTVALCDEVTVTVRDDEKLVMTGLDLRPCAGSQAEEGEKDGQDIPAPKAGQERLSGSGKQAFTQAGLLTFGPENLCVRAAEAFRKAYGITAGVDIYLEKRIPVAAGLAGGSADAAAVLRAMRKLFAPEVSDEDLLRLAIGLGADIPYCIGGGTALCEGIGEEITPLSAFGPCTVVLVKPVFPISTGEAYGDYDRISAEQPGLFRRPDNAGLVQLLRTQSGDRRSVQQASAAKESQENQAFGESGTDTHFSRQWASDFSKAMGNVLRDVAVLKHPEISFLEEDLKLHGAFASQMSGSGPTVFGLFESMEMAEEAAMAIADLPGIESSIVCCTC